MLFEMRCDHVVLMYTSAKYVRIAKTTTALQLLETRGALCALLLHCCVYCCILPGYRSHDKTTLVTGTEYSSKLQK